MQIKRTINMVGSKNWAGLCFLSGHVVQRGTHNWCQNVYTTSNQSSSADSHMASAQFKSL